MILFQRKHEIVPSRMMLDSLVRSHGGRAQRRKQVNYNPVVIVIVSIILFYQFLINI